MNIRRAFHLISGLVILSLMFGLVGCNTSTPQPTTVPTNTTLPPSPTLPSTSTPTVSPTPLPTSTPTSTPQPTATPTLVPTSTPVGFYSHFNAGFSLIYPANFSIAQESTSELYLKDKNGLFSIDIGSFPGSKAATAASVVASFQGANTGLTFTPVNTPVTTTIGSATQADQVDVLIKSSQGMIYMRLIVAFYSHRNYLVQIVSGKNIFDANKSILDPILASIQLFKPQPYGLPADQTIVQLGSNPLAKYLDPAQDGAGAYLNLMFATLINMTADMKIIPGLAEKWTTNRDGTVYTFTLYENLKFANGSPITADSVVASWERTTDPKFKATNPSLYLGDILGVKDKLAGKATTIAGLKVIDNRTLQVTLDGAKPYFLAKLRFSTAAIIDVNDADLKPTDWEFSANASGPYKINKYIKDEAMILERNPNYPLQPAVQYLVYLFEPGGSPISLYEDGTLDLLPIGPDDVKRVSAPDDPLHNEMHTTTSMCTDMLLINTDRPPLDDVNVRKALVLALDKNELNSKYSDNYEIVADSILPPAMPGFTQHDPAKFDPAEAKKALAASKYGVNLPPIKLIFAGTAGTTPQMATLLSDMWKKNLGITVTVELEDPTDYEKAARSSTGNVFDFGWCADYPDPENFLDILYHSQSAMNISLLKNPRVDALLEKARTEMDGATRLQLYQQSETILLDEVDTIPLFNSVLTYLVKPRIKGATIPSIAIDIEPWLSIQ